MMTQFVCGRRVAARRADVFQRTDSYRTYVMTYVCMIRLINKIMRAVGISSRLNSHAPDQRQRVT